MDSSLRLPKKKDLVINVEAVRVIETGNTSSGMLSKKRTVTGGLGHTSGTGKPSHCGRQQKECPALGAHIARAHLCNGTCHPLSDMLSMSWLLTQCPGNVGTPSMYIEGMNG